MRGTKMNHNNEQQHDQDAEIAFLQSTHDLTAIKARYTAYGVAQHLISLMHLINNLQQSTGDLFKVSDINDESVSQDWIGRIICTYPADHKNRLLYNSLLDHLTFWSQSVADEFPMHEFNPYFRYFLNEANECGFCFSPFDDFDFIFYRCEERTVSMCAKLNKFVNSIRKIQENASVVAEMQEFKRASDDNYRSGVNYVETLFDKYSRLMVVRVDLAYRKHHLVSDPLQQFVPEHFVTSADEFLTHHQKMLEGLQRYPIFEHLRGYMIKIEHGREKGFHCHCLFMFNGSKVRQGISIGQMIGWYWVNEITDNKGSFYNCNLYPNYFYDGLGMVNRDDTKKLTGIEYAVKYMTKPDAIVRLYLGNTQVFTKGVTPEIADMRLGRPRAV
jgi:hypothetical protein